MSYCFVIQIISLMLKVNFYWLLSLCSPPYHGKLSVFYGSIILFIEFGTAKIIHQKADCKLFSKFLLTQPHFFFHFPNAKS